MKPIIYKPPKVRDRIQRKTREDYQEEYKKTIRLLRQGFSVRKTAVLSGISISTTQRIKKMFDL